MIQARIDLSKLPEPLRQKFQERLDALPWARQGAADPHHRVGASEPPGALGERCARALQPAWQDRSAQIAVVTR